MAKFVYVLGVQKIHCYSVKDDGSLLPLGPIPADGYILGPCNNSKYPLGDNYLFTAGSDSVTGMPGIDVYQVQQDGSLNQVVDHYTKGLEAEQSAVTSAFTVMQWPGTASYFAYIGADTVRPSPAESIEILGYKFTPPGNMEYMGPATSNLPSFIQGPIDALVSAPGEDGAQTAPRLYGLYGSGEGQATYAASFSSSAFGKLSYDDSGKLAVVGGIFLAVCPNQKFLYIGYMSGTEDGEPTGNGGEVFGFRIDGGKFAPIGNTELSDELMAIAASPDGKYLIAGTGRGELLAFSIGPDGRLEKSSTQMNGAHASARPKNKTGGGMAGLAVDPESQYVYYAFGSSVSVRKIEADGNLSPIPGVDVGEEVGDIAIFEV